MLFLPYRVDERTVMCRNNDRKTGMFVEREHVRVCVEVCHATLTERCSNATFDPVNTVSGDEVGEERGLLILEEVDVCSIANHTDMKHPVPHKPTEGFLIEPEDSDS
jgi:hypothetical protein